ncbi:MAG TPA: nucleotide exchange factor GrpE [Steroidobacteraceae bacterium]|nr:nucleotide exchange factor GrpE [Steroidobacteraceae bacterium]
MSENDAERNPAAAVDGIAAEQTEAADELSSLRQQLAEAQAAAVQGREQVLRAAAELDNIRKRAARDMEQAHRYALERFAQELLPVADSLELAVASAAGADAASLAAGQEATLRLLASAFVKFAIQPIDPAGERFDPERHEAMAMQPSTTAEPDSVLQVVQRGYQLNGRLLWPARVIVARAPDNT